MVGGPENLLNKANNFRNPDPSERKYALASLNIGKWINIYKLWTDNFFRRKFTERFGNVDR